MVAIHLDSINRESKSPIYRQIAEQIRLQISDGRMPVGTRLPTVRELAESLSITKLTVQNAYRDLQTGGWIESTVGRGTYVSASTDHQALVATIGQHRTPDHVMHDMNRLARLSGMRSMAYAEPDPAMYPTAEYMRFFESPAAVNSSLMQYAPAQGDELLRIELAKLLATHRIAATPQDILVTSGVSQGLSILAGCLTHPGDCVVTEQPGYLGMLHVLNTYGVTPIGVRLDQEGVCLDELERVIQEHHPRFLYTIPSFQNPTGACMSQERRRDLLALAVRYGLIIVEDDIYGVLSYDCAEPMPLKALDQTNNVIYLSSFSKMLMPGIRIGYMVIPEHLCESFVLHRQALDLSGPLLLQRALANFLHRGRLKVHLDRVIPRYRARRDELMRALEGNMPHDVQWTRPEGGFCCWLTLPPDRVPDDLQQMALRHGVAFTPGDAFLVQPDGFSHMRLCFGAPSPEIIREAITILGSLLRQPHSLVARRPHGTKDDCPLV